MEPLARPCLLAKRWDARIIENNKKSQTCTKKPLVIDGVFILHA